MKIIEQKILKSESYYWARKHRMRQVVSMVARDTAFPLTPHIEEAVAILTPPPDSVVVQLAASW